MNVVPVYLTDSTVKSVLEDLPNDPKVGQMTKKELRDTVFKRLNISSVYSVTPSHIKVTKGRNVNIVTVEYEPRGTLIGNLEYIVHFKHEVKITTR
ncbi:MAG TPA: DUF4845 domain-containing protein [Gammaproteobacteria bacterium]|nr:DUF4845 domain-containing protein [Gammaproteobacteria bacterium]